MWSPGIMICSPIFQGFYDGQEMCILHVGSYHRLLWKSKEWRKWSKMRLVFKFQDFFCFLFVGNLHFQEIRNTSVEYLRIANWSSRFYAPKSFLTKASWSIVFSAIDPGHTISNICETDLILWIVIRKPMQT